MESNTTTALYIDPDTSPLIHRVVAMIHDLRVKMADQDDSRAEKVTSLLQVCSFKFVKRALAFMLLTTSRYFIDYQYPLVKFKDMSM